jgi:hypothetical protein
VEELKVKEPAKKCNSQMCNDKSCVEMAGEGEVKAEAATEEPAKKSEVPNGAATLSISALLLSLTFLA